MPVAGSCAGQAAAQPLLGPQLLQPCGQACQLLAYWPSRTEARRALTAYTILPPNSCSGCEWWAPRLPPSNSCRRRRTARPRCSGCGALCGCRACTTCWGSGAACYSMGRAGREHAAAAGPAQLVGAQVRLAEARPGSWAGGVLFRTAGWFGCHPMRPCFAQYRCAESGKLTSLLAAGASGDFEVNVKVHKRSVIKASPPRLLPPRSVHEMEGRQQLFDDRLRFKLGPAAAPSAAATASWGLAPAAAAAAAGEPACCIEVVREGLAPAGP